MIQAGLSKTCRQVPAHHAHATLSRTMGNRAAFLRRPRNTDSFNQFRPRFASRHAYFALAKKKGGPLPRRPRRNRPRLRRFPPSPPETPRTGCGRTWPPETPQGRRERPRAAPRSALAQRCGRPRQACARRQVALPHSRHSDSMPAIRRRISASFDLRVCAVLVLVTRAVLLFSSLPGWTGQSSNRRPAVCRETFAYWMPAFAGMTTCARSAPPSPAPPPRCGRGTTSPHRGRGKERVRGSCLFT